VKKLTAVPEEGDPGSVGDAMNTADVAATDTAEA